MGWEGVGDGREGRGWGGEVHLEIPHSKTLDPPLAAFITTCRCILPVVTPYNVAVLQ